MSARVGSLLLMRYGNGTQAVRVREITPRGGFKLDRFIPDTLGWRSSKTTVSPTDPRIVGDLLPTDPRRKLPGFGNV